MAGQPGRSGGPRPNSGGARANSGGARPGAGRPRKIDPGTTGSGLAGAGSTLPDQRTPSRDPLQFLLDVMQGKYRPTDAQIKAAIAVLPYVHARADATGKKASAQSAAREAATRGGKFAPRLPAGLRVVKSEG